MNLTASNFNDSVLLECATTLARELQSTRTKLHPQASLRIPVTPANREYLRALRAAEAEAWEAADHYAGVSTQLES